MPHKQMDAETAIAAIQTFVARYGYVPTRADFIAKGNGLPSLQVLARQFRHWQWAVQAAGYPQQETSR